MRVLASVDYVRIRGLRQFGDKPVTKVLGGHLPEGGVGDQSLGELRDPMAGVVSALEDLGQSRPVALSGEAGVDLIGEGAPAMGGVTLRVEPGPDRGDVAELAGCSEGRVAVPLGHGCAQMRGSGPEADTGAAGCLGCAGRPG